MGQRKDGDTGCLNAIPRSRRLVESLQERQISRRQFVAQGRGPRTLAARDRRSARRQRLRRDASNGTQGRRPRPPAREPGGTLREGYDLDFSRMDPINTSWYDPGFFALYEAAITLDQKAKFVPQLATGWSREQRRQDVDAEDQEGREVPLRRARDRGVDRRRVQRDHQPEVGKPADRDVGAGEEGRSPTDPTDAQDLPEAPVREPPERDRDRLLADRQHGRRGRSSATTTARKSSTAAARSSSSSGSPATTSRSSAGTPTRARARPSSRTRGRPTSTASTGSTSRRRRAARSRSRTASSTRCTGRRRRTSTA